MYKLWRMRLGQQNEHLIQSKCLFSPSEMERHQNVPGVRQIFHFTWPGTNASGVLGQVHAGEA